MHNSTIKRKPCKCGCGKLPKLGYKGYAGLGCIPQEIKDANPEKFKIRSISHRNRAKINDISRKIHSYQLEKNKPNNGLKSDLLKKADNLFSKFIKKRDSDEKGNVTCKFCQNTYNLKDKDSSGDYIIQAMHFVSRSVYSLRYSENNVHAGCCFCNKSQYDNPNGEVYETFKRFLYHKIGVEAVWAMEAEKRNINKLSHADLEDVIKKYT
ncbi:MAG: recombination protein NinG [Chitinophagaceae bacterium]|nr:recombination protein NinG [Chitinophagaceae bacterium]